jgi:hypothetical protein
MSRYGAEWVESEEGDILPPDEAVGIDDTDRVDYDSLVDVATAFVDAQDEPSKNYVLEQSIALEYGSKYYETAALIKESLETSRAGGFSKGREVQLNGQWVPAARFASGELYRLRGSGGLTQKGFNELWDLLGMPPQASGEEKQVTTAGEDDSDKGRRHIYQDVAKAAANDY